MRMDAKALLEKLNRTDFGYREFSDPLATIEPWPIFEALLADSRVVGTRQSRVKVEGRDAAVAVRPAQPAAEPLGFFANYSLKPKPAPRKETEAPEPVNMRALLGRLAGRA